MNPKSIVAQALTNQVAVPAFNVPNLNMVEPIIRAVADENSVAMIQVARLEWEKMDAVRLEAVAEAYAKHANTNHVMLHLDHVPVIDEDMQRVDFTSIIRRAIAAGYQSVMVDGSRLPLLENIIATAEAVALAHAHQVPCEAEIGAVMGHEGGEMPPYEEIFSKKMGFTKEEELTRFVRESGCDWVSVAVGNFHGAIAESNRFAKKPEAKLDVAHIATLQRACNIPLVLHGGSGIKKEYILQGIRSGIAKINVGSDLRRAYQVAFENANSVIKAQDALYDATRSYLRNELELSNTRDLLK